MELFQNECQRVMNEAGLISNPPPYHLFFGCSLVNRVFLYDLQILGGNITFWVNIVVVKFPHSKQGSVFRDTLFKYFCLHIYVFSKFLTPRSRLNYLQTTPPPRLTVSCTYALLNTSSSTAVEIRAPILTTASVLKNEGMLRAQMRFATGLY